MGGPRLNNFPLPAANCMAVSLPSFRMRIMELSNALTRQRRCLVNAIVHAQIILMSLTIVFLRKKYRHSRNKM